MYSKWKVMEVNQLNASQLAEATAGRSHSSLLLLWNCTPTTSSHQCKDELQDQSLAGTLGLDRTKWPAFLNTGTVVEHRELVVPLQAALSEEDRSAEMHVIVLAVVRHLGPQRQFTTCNSKDLEDCGQARFDQSCVVVVAESINEYALSAWEAKKSYRVDELNILRCHHQIWIALKQIAEHMLATPSIRAKGKDTTDYQRAVQTLRSLQAVQSAVANAPTHTSPIPLGYCMEEQWKLRRDPCKSTPSTAPDADHRHSVTTMLTTSCRLGHCVIYRRQLPGEHNRSAKLSPSDWLPRQCHIVKETLMRTVYTGRAVAKIEGTVGDKSHSFASLRVQQCEDKIPDIRHRAVFIL